MRNIKSKMRTGVTLIELALVILILSILMTILMGMFYMSSKVSKESVPSSREKGKALLAVEMMRVALNNTYYIPEIERLVFVARNGRDGFDRITFATYNSGSELIGASAVREVSFYVKKNSNSDDTGILMRRDDEGVDENPGEGGSHYEILPGVQRLSFKFTLDGKNWLDDWNTKKTKAIPRLIMISMTVKNDKGGTDIYESVAGPGIYLK